MKRRLILLFLTSDSQAYRRAIGGTWYELADYNAGWPAQWWQQQRPRSDRDIVSMERYEAEQ